MRNILRSEVVGKTRVFVDVVACGRHMVERRFVGGVPLVISAIADLKLAAFAPVVQYSSLVYSG